MYLSIQRALVTSNSCAAYSSSSTSVGTARSGGEGSGCGQHGEARHTLHESSSFRYHSRAAAAAAAAAAAMARRAGQGSALLKRSPWLLENQSARHKNEIGSHVPLRAFDTQPSSCSSTTLAPTAPTLTITLFMPLYASLCRSIAYSAVSSSCEPA